MWSFNRTPANALEIFLQVSGQEAFTIFWCNNLLLLFAPTVLSKKKACIWLIYLLFIYHNTDKWSHTSSKQMYVCTGFPTACRQHGAITVVQYDGLPFSKVVPHHQPTWASLHNDSAPAWQVNQSPVMLNLYRRSVLPQPWQDMSVDIIGLL